MADGTFPQLISKDRDSNAASNPIFTQLSDGTTVVTVTSGALSVNFTNTSIAVTDGGGSLTVDGTVELGATTLAALESITVQNGAGASAVNIQDGGNSITVDGTVSIASEKIDDSAFGVATDKVTGSGYLADEVATDSVDEGDIGIARMTLDRKQLFVLVDKTTDANRLVISASGEASISQKSHALTNANALPISKNNTANSETNPMYVQPVETSVSGSEVHNYNTASAVAADGTSNHDYTVTGTTMFLKSIIVAGSGNIKFEIRTGPLASLVTKAVGFLTGREGDSKQINFNPPIEIPVTGTGTVRIIRTNRQNQAVDVYSTILGNDV